ncbi:MAG: hypothetical protein IBJ18_08985 [Phycisphaerales bacterium]|nr:hypothetical protein [Phycisphaerales bacterium]
MRQSLGFIGSLRALMLAAPLGVIAACALFLALVLVVYVSLPVLNAATTPVTKPDFTAPSKAERENEITRAENTLKLAGERVAARSPFYPLKPKQPDTPRVTPRVYGGSDLVAIYDDSAWFRDGRRLKVNDTSDANLSVISVNPPWGAKVRWQGAEFDITLFERSKDILTSGSSFKSDSVVPSSFLSSRPGSSSSSSSSSFSTRQPPQGGPMPPPPGGPPPGAPGFTPGNGNGNPPDAPQTEPAPNGSPAPTPAEPSTAPTQGQPTQGQPVPAQVVPINPDVPVIIQPGQPLQSAPAVPSTPAPPNNDPQHTDPPPPPSAAQPT